MIIYLLTKKIAHLRQIRQGLEAQKHTVVSCCSTSALLNACMQGPGIILIDGNEFDYAEVHSIQEKIRLDGYPDPILITEQYPTAKRALRWSHLPVCDYFPWQIISESLHEILENAQNWMKREGEKSVIHAQLIRQWNSLDTSLKDVLHLLYTGYTNREIAEKLALSNRTVESRRAKLLTTFGVNNFAELIRVATLFMEEGTLPKSLLITVDEEK
ncbi:MAG: LuxR C-terminal-related transcriptional regulator [Planctomycetia bacterium]|nr:LuxR C-terminal-related transcriptional regulator [Planctomycetia bacterium]